MVVDVYSTAARWFAIEMMGTEFDIWRELTGRVADHVCTTTN